MKKLLSYLNALATAEQAAFAARCETTVGYLRKAISVNQPIREALCINIERESGGSVRCEDLRADVDWDFIRGTDQAAPQQKQAQAATETVAINTDALPPISDLPLIVATPAAPAWDGIDRRSPAGKALPPELDRRATVKASTHV